MTLIERDSENVSTYPVLKLLATGEPAVGYTITDLDLQFTRNGSAPAAKVDATALTAIDDPHADNKAFEVDGTSSAGLFRVDWPDAAFASGVRSVNLCVSGPGLDPSHEEIQLVPPGVVEPQPILFISIAAPKQLVTPKSGTTDYTIRYRVLDVNNEPIAPDSLPTIAMQDGDGSDVSGRLSDHGGSGGEYTVTYTATAGDPPTQLTLGVLAAKSGYTGGTDYETIMLETARSINPIP